MKGSHVFHDESLGDICVIGPLTHFWSLLSLILRGSHVTSYSVSFSSMMQSFCCFTLFLLCSLSLLSAGLSIQCNSMQYPWPTEAPTLCCNKCQPGLYMESRSQTSCHIKCEHCTGDRYTDVYNVDMSCNVCDTCNKPNFLTKTNCTSISNTVCKCKTGYRCKDEICTKCVPIPTPIKPTLPPATTATSRAPDKPNKGTEWFLVIIALLCAGIALVVLTKIKTFLHCIMSNKGYFLEEKPSTESSSTEDDDVSKPIQEVCGKCDQPIDIV